MYNLEDKNVLDIDTRQERPTRPIVSYFSLEGDQEYIDIEIYNATLEESSILKYKRDMAVKGFYFDPKYQRNYRRIYTERGAEIFGLQEMNFVRRVKIVGFPKFNQKKRKIKKLMETWGHSKDEIDFCLASCRFDYQIDSDDNLIIQVSNLIEAINFNPIEIHTSSMIPCNISDALSEEVQDKFEQIEELVVNIDLKDDVIEYLEKSKSVSALRFSGRANGKTLRTRGLDILALLNDMSSTTSEAPGEPQLDEAESDHQDNKRGRDEFEDEDVYNTSPPRKCSPPQKPSPPLITKSVTFRTQEQIEEYFD
ncbi:predicted protein [Naegleria gruberi]|uniref:Predicted protein n=1 Tax=Naegleria gruberi TaxID=5762 RepID=D2V4Q6_NAEGR|nr:uncharacterized protein NAEGRDRAFT_46705 [Naegleria gruberi]EFC47974.1 predicted protein [Naegleria gruberi]|eukprot:XP_002680718.1 predicted protein [Naegleria gruberi strain NEG-M]